MYTIYITYLYVYIYIIDAICLSGIFGSNKNPGEDLKMLKCQPSSRSTSELQKKNGGNPVPVGDT